MEEMELLKIPASILYLLLNSVRKILLKFCFSDPFLVMAGEQNVFHVLLFFFIYYFLFYLAVNIVT